MEKCPTRCRPPCRRLFTWVAKGDGLPRAAAEAAPCVQLCRVGGGCPALIPLSLRHPCPSEEEQRHSDPQATLFRGLPGSGNLRFPCRELLWWGFLKLVPTVYCKPQSCRFEGWISLPVTTLVWIPQAGAHSPLQAWILQVWRLSVLTCDHQMQCLESLNRLLSEAPLSSLINMKVQRQGNFMACTNQYAVSF